MYKLVSTGGSIMNRYLKAVPALVSGLCSVQG